MAPPPVHCLNTYISGHQIYTPGTNPKGQGLPENIEIKKQQFFRHIL